MTLGQSAIEYLMTYGWMLLVVAVAGGAIYSILGDQSIDSSSGFTGGDIAVENFGVSSDDRLDMVLRATSAEEVDVKKVTVNQSGTEIETWIGKEIAVGDSVTASALGVVDSGSGSNSIDVTVQYDTGGLEDLSVEGTVTGSINVDAQDAAPNDNWAFVDASEVPDRTLDNDSMGDFYMMKYEAAREGNATSGNNYNPVSKVNFTPWTSITQPDARSACRDQNWDLPRSDQWQSATMAEIGDSSTQPHGNNDNAKAIEDSSETCVVDSSLSGSNVCITGSGPETWSNELGIYDLNGNVWEWTSQLYDPSDPEHLGGGNNNGISKWDRSGYAKSAGSNNASLGNDSYWGNDNTDRTNIRGGGPGNGQASGVFAYNLNDNTGSTFSTVGFRCVKE